MNASDSQQMGDLTGRILKENTSGQIARKAAGDFFWSGQRGIKPPNQEEYGTSFADHMNMANGIETAEQFVQVLADAESPEEIIHILNRIDRDATINFLATLSQEASPELKRKFSAVSGPMVQRAKERHKSGPPWPTE